MSRAARWVVAAAVVLAAAIGVIMVFTAGGGSAGRRTHHANPTAPQATAPFGTPPQSRSAPRGHPPAIAHPRVPRTLPRMLGQMIVARFAGPAPSAMLLSRVRAGQVGGIILFADNLADGIQATKKLTATLQQTASEGGNPPLLIMTDQEGGEVKRLPGPPSLAPAEMTSTGVAFAQGRATGQLLREAGINVDLAPVADVEEVADSFLGTRSFGADPSIVAQRACAFAAGLASERVAYTLKHFPGLGFATASTDRSPVSVSEPTSSLRSAYQAYEACGNDPLALIMVSSAIYPGLSGPLPAVMTRAIYDRELPLATRSSSTVTISDDLETPAIAGQLSPARQAINAGLDVLLYAETEQASSDAYARLLVEARSGLLSTTRIEAANREIAKIKLQIAR